MAKVHVEYDTNTKEAAVHVDGKKVENLSAVRLEKQSYGGKPGESVPYFLDMHQHEKDDEHDTMCHHHTMASERVKAGLKFEDSKLIEGLKVVSLTEPIGKKKSEKITSDILDFFTEE